MATYQILSSNGDTSGAWSRTYETRDAAARAIAQARGWDDVVLSSSFADTDGDGAERRAWCAYETQEQCDADDTGANAPWVIEVSS